MKHTISFHSHVSNSTDIIQSILSTQSQSCRRLVQPSSFLILRRSFRLRVERRGAGLQLNEDEGEYVPQCVCMGGLELSSLLPPSPLSILTPPLFSEQSIRHKLPHVDSNIRPREEVGMFRMCLENQEMRNMQTCGGLTHPSWIPNTTKL